MTLSEALLPEFDHEMANTRKSLERVPEGKLDWQPHTKSMTLGHLAGHLAEIPTWATSTLNEESFDLAPIDGPAHKPFKAKSVDEALERFDKNVAAARSAIEGTSDEAILKPWSLLHGGNTVFTMPLIAVLRSFVMSHTIHHRAQLGVYLRLNDVPVPAIYGPSADESGM